jgi:membrane-associated phospholipid phosphatase
MQLLASDPQSPSPTPPAKNQPGPVKRGFKRGLEDQKQIYTAPFQRKNLKWDLLFLAGTAGLIALDKHASEALSPDHANLSRVVSDLGLYSTIGAVGLLGVAGFKNGDRHARETAVLGAESFANTLVVYSFTQLIAGRQRPLEGNHNGDFFKNHALSSSFPSAHSAFTWSLASVVAHEYPRPWVQWLAYGTATTVSVTRFTALKHFPSDVAVGAVFGYLIGQHIFHAHCTVGLSPSCHANKEKSR